LAVVLALQVSTVGLSAGREPPLSGSQRPRTRTGFPGFYLGGLHGALPPPYPRRSLDQPQSRRHRAHARLFGGLLRGLAAALIIGLPIAGQREIVSQVHQLMRLKWPVRR